MYAQVVRYLSGGSRKSRRRTGTVNYSLHYRVRIRSVIVRLRILFSTKFYSFGLLPNFTIAISTVASRFDGNEISENFVQSA